MGVKRLRIARIALPTPLPAGPVNVYLLKGDAVVLVDAGFDSPEGRQILDFELRRRKLSTKDLDAILLTHGHLDHFGMAARLKEASGAKVWAHRSDRLFLERYPASHDRVWKRFIRHGKRHGFSEEEFEGMFGLYRENYSSGAAVVPDHFYEEGKGLSFGSTEIETVFTPGHTAGSTCLVEMGSGRFFSGDSVLKQMTPVSFFSGGTRGVGLGVYRTTLEKLREWNVRKVYPGHGRPFRGLPGVIDRIQRHIELRLQRVREGFPPGQSKGLREIAEMAFGVTPLEVDRWMGFGEVLGMMEVLEKEGAVCRLEGDEGAFRFMAK